MCPKCSKGALCIDCLKAAPVSVQRSWTRAKIRTIFLIGVVTLLFGIPLVIIRDNGKANHLFNFSNTILLILAAVEMLGVIGLAIVIKKYDGWKYRWYLKNRAQLPPNEFS